MRTYIIGDVHGSFKTLMSFLSGHKVDLKYDKLIFVGDLINKGKRTLDVLDWVIEVKNDVNVTCLMGNHELAFFNHYFTLKLSSKGSGIAQMIKSSKREQYFNFLRGNSFVYNDQDYLCVHGGIPPWLDVNETLKASSDLEEIIKGEDFGPFMRFCFEKRKKCKKNYSKVKEEIDSFSTLALWDTLYWYLEYFTACRFLRNKKYFDYFQKVAPEDNNDKSLSPWFEERKIQEESPRIFFGHWATLGARILNEHKCISLDSGAVYGQKLSCYELENKKLIQEKYCD